MLVYLMYRKSCATLEITMRKRLTNSRIQDLSKISVHNLPSYSSICDSFSVKYFQKNVSN